MIDFDALYTRYHQSLARYILRLVPRPEAAEDIAQTTWLKAWVALSAVEERGVGAWLFRIARNTALDDKRRFGLRMRAGEACSYESEDVAFADPRDFTEAIEQRECYERAFASLPERHRDALQRHLDGRVYHGAAERMQLSRARKAYRAALAEVGA